MMPVLDALLVGVLVLNLFVLGNSRLRSVIHLAAAQGALLGVISLVARELVGAPEVLTSLAIMLLKGLLIPGMLLRALREAQISREVEPLVGLLPSMLLGAFATGLSMIFAAQLPLAPGHETPLLVPAALSTVLAGFIMLATRYKAISQVIGYLILENGIFIFGMLLVDAMPLIVELGVLLDLFVGIFVTCIIVSHINRAFSSLDTRNLAELKE